MQEQEQNPTRSSSNSETEIPDYYWRDYSGTIPRDAVPGGKDLNRKVTYIAQIYKNKYGILPGRIYQDEKLKVKSSVNSWCFDEFVANCPTKILCSPNLDRFSWMPVTENNLHIITAGKHLVVGGNDYNNYVLHIGRLQYQGELIVGRVCGRDLNNAKLYFPHQNVEQLSPSFWVLIYNL